MTDLPFWAAGLAVAVAAFACYALGRRDGRKREADARNAGPALGFPYAARGVMPQVFNLLRIVTGREWELMQADDHGRRLMIEHIAADMGRDLIASGAVHVAVESTPHVLGGEVRLKMIAYRLGPDGVPTMDPPPRPRVQVPT